MSTSIETECFDVQEQPPLLVPLLSNLSKLPANFPIQLPRKIAEHLIRGRLALPIGNMSIRPDLIIEEDDLEHAGHEFAVWA